MKLGPLLIALSANIACIMQVHAQTVEMTCYNLQRNTRLT